MNVANPKNGPSGSTKPEKKGTKTFPKNLTHPLRFELVARSEIIARLRSFGTNWEQSGVEPLLKIPAKGLFVMKSDAVETYSDNDSFGVSSIISGVISGSLKVFDSQYGITFYQTSNSLYVVFVDIKSKGKNKGGIIVRRQISCIHNHPPKQDWATVTDAIKGAMEFAKSHQGKIAVDIGGELRSLDFSKNDSGNDDWWNSVP